MSTKDKLQTRLERAAYDHVQRVKESTVDFIHLYVQRNNINVDRPSMAKVLEIMRTAIESEHLNKLELFNQQISESLDEFVNETVTSSLEEANAKAKK